LVFGTLLFAGVIYYLGPAKLLDTLKGVRPGLLALSIVPFLGIHAVRIFKWKAILKRAELDFGAGELFAKYFSSQFWGMILPGRGGEAAPALFADRDRGRVMSLIVFDRVIETVQTVMAISMLAMWLSGGHPSLTALAIMFTGFFLLLLMCIILFSRKVGTSVFGVFSRLAGMSTKGALASRLRGFMDSVTRELDDYYNTLGRYYSAGFVLYLLALTFVAWFGYVYWWVILFGSLGADVSVGVAASAMVAFTLIGAVAPLPGGGLGASDLGAVLVLGGFGMGEEAGGVIILYRVLNTAYLYASYLLSKVGYTETAPSGGR